MRRPRSGRRRRRRLLKRTVLVVAALVVGSLVVDAVGGSRLARQAQQASERNTPAQPTTTNGVTGQSAARSGEEEFTLPIPKGESSAAGDPADVAREFALAWINRPANKTQLQAQNERLISLSRGFFANQLGATLKAKVGSGSRGTVVGVQVIRRSVGSEVVLVTTREQLAPDGKPAEPYHYGLYLARLERAGEAFAVSSWEPQF
jgi:hypothetical protein